MKTPPLPPNEAARLEALARTDLLDSESEVEFDDVVAIASQICATPIALVSLVDEKRQWFKARIGVEARETPRDVAFCAHAIVAPDPFVVADATADERFRDNPLVVGEPHVRFYAGVPLVTPDGHAIGTLCVIDREARVLAPEQHRALVALARQVMVLVGARRKARDLAAANRALEERARELAASEARFRDLAESSRDLIARITPHGKILYVSPAVRGLLGYEPDEVLGRALDEVIHPDDLEAVAATRRSDLRGEPPTDAILRRLRARDGTYVWTESTRSFTRDASGAITEIQVTARDVTVRVAAERALADTARAKDQLIATVSHELRTPLTAIRGAVGLLANGVVGELPEDARPVAEIALSNCDRLLRLVNDVLDLEKIGAGHASPSLRDARPADLVETTAASIAPTAAAAKVTIEVGVSTRHDVRVDADQIVRVLTNLVSNAISFSPPGALVRVTARDEGANVRFEVTDAGPGITEEGKARLFRPFEQLERTGARRSGTGLGLVISKAIVEQHGGSIGVDSRVGEGSTFYFTLPRG